MASSPVIKHTDLFAFDEYEKAIQEVQQSTIDFTKAITKATSTLTIGFNEAKDSLNDYKKEAQGAKNIDSFAAMNKHIEEAAEKYTNLKYAIDGNNKIMIAAGSSISMLNDEAKELKKTYNALSEEERKNEDIGGKIIKTLAQQKAATKEYNDQLKEATKAITTVDNSYSQLSDELNRLRNELKNMPNAFNASTGAINDQNAEAVELSKKISQVDAAVKNMDKTMGQFGRNVGNYESATVSLKQELKALTAELAAMKMAGEENTEAYAKLIERAGEVKDTLSDVAAEVKRVGSDTQTIEGLVGVMEGVAGATAIAEGSMQLFGSENEFVAESIKKLQAVQTLLLGVQSIGNLVQKESAAVLLVVNAQRKLEVLNTNLQAAAESKNIFVRKSATAAQWLLNKAMLANPVGLLLVAVAALATAVVLLSRKTIDQNEEQIKLNESTQRFLDIQKETIGWINQTSAAKVKDKEETLRLNKEAGYSNEALARSEQELLDAKLELSESNYLLAKGSFENNEFFKNKNIKSLKELETATISTVQAVTQAKAVLTEDSPIYDIGGKLTNSEEYNNYVKRLETEAQVTKSQYDILKGYYDDYENTKTQYREYYTRIERVAQENKLKNELAFLDARLLKTKEGSYAEYQARRDQIVKTRDIELKNVNLLEGEKEKIRADARKKLLQLDKDYNFQVASDSKNTEISKLNAQLSIAKDGSDQQYSLKTELLQKQYDLEVLSINNTVLNEELRAAKVAEVYNKMLADKRELEKQKKLAELEYRNDSSIGAENLDIVRNQQVLASTRSTNEEIIAAQDNIRKIQEGSILREIKLNEDKFAVLKELGLDDVNATYEYEKRKTEITIEEEQKRLEEIERVAEAERTIRDLNNQIITEGITAGFTIFQDQANARIESINSEKEAAIAAAGDNANAKARIEEEYGKKVAKEKRKAAIAAKAESLFSIAIDTARAVMAAYRSLVGIPIVGPALATQAAIRTGILGAIQMAVVAAKPIPKFRHGIESAPEGPAIVNDEPGSNYQEMIVSKGVSYIPRKRNQLVYLRGGDKVVRADKTRGIMSNLHRMQEFNRLSNEKALHDKLSLDIESGKRMEVQHIMSSALLNSRVDEKAIGNEVGKHIANIPVEHHSWDERGYQKRVRRGNTIINDLNSRNSL